MSDPLLPCIKCKVLPELSAIGQNIFSDIDEYPLTYKCLKCLQERGEVFASEIEGKEEELKRAWNYFNNPNQNPKHKIQEKTNEAV